jgi:hypothetical protein
MADIIPFRKRDDTANTIPVIFSDYWGDTFPLLELLEALEKHKSKPE